MIGYDVEKRRIGPDEYIKIRQTTDWKAVTQKQASKALENDLFSVCILYSEAS